MLGGDYLISVLVCYAMFLEKSFMNVCDQRGGGGLGGWLEEREGETPIPGVTVVPCISQRVCAFK